MSRARLFARFEAVDEHPVVLVRGPGGSGKSMLVADWLRRRTTPIPTTWFALDRGASTRAGFWQRLARTLLDDGGIAGNARLTELADGLVDAAVGPGIVLDILRASPAPLLLVLDDLHLADDASIDDLIWLAERAERLRIIAISRRRLRFEANDIVARLETVVLTPSDLALTLDEGLELATALDADVTDAEVALVVRRAAGHPLGTRVAFAAIQTARSSPGPVVVDAVVTEVAEATSRDLIAHLVDERRRDAALRLALLPVVDIELAARVIGQDDAPAVLRMFEEDGVGVTHDRRGTLVFEFQPIVLDALRLAAAREIDADTARSVRRLALDWLRDNGDAFDALRVAVDLDEDGVVFPLITRRFSELMTYDPAQVEAILERVPRDRLLRDGGIAAALAMARSERELTPSATVRGLADAALAALEQDRIGADPLRRFLALAGMLGAQRAARRYDATGPYADELVALIDALPPAARDAAGHAVGAALVQLDVTYIVSGRFDDAIAVAHRLANDPHSGRRIHRLVLLAFMHAMRGELREARAFLSDIDTVQLASWRATKPANGWYVAETLLALEQGDAATALETISELDDQVELLEYWPYLVWTKGLVRLASHPSTGADEVGEALRKLRGRGASAFALAQLAGLRADLALAAGHPDNAGRILASEDESFPAIRLARARLELSGQRPTEALRQAKAVVADELASPRHRLEALAVQAVSAARLEDQEGAIEVTRTMLAVAERHDLRAPLMMVPAIELAQLITTVDAEQRPLLDGLPDPFGTVLSTRRLSHRERLVLSALASNSSVKDVAAALFVSPNTVKSQLRSIYAKLGATTRTEALAAARRYGLLEQ